MITLWCVVLAFLGLSVACIAWFILRFAVGGPWGFLAFWFVALATFRGIVQMAVAYT